MSEHLLLQAVAFLATAVFVVPIFKWAKQAPILGFLAAGLILGPSGFALVAHPDAVLHFAELGVVLMLFLLGLELSPKILWQLRHSIFILGAAQLFGSTIVIYLGLYLFNLEFYTQVFLAYTLALSSTAFAVQLMSDNQQLSTPMGRDGFAVLLFQDLAVIPLLLLTAWLGRQVGTATEEAHIAPWYLIALTFLGLALAGKFGLPLLLKIVANTHVRELQTALALLLVMGSAWWMEHLGLSMGLGAFIAGVILANSHYRHQLESDIEPFKGLLLGLFFMAVGMSMPLSLMLTHTAWVIGVLVLLLVFKTVLLAVVAKLKGHSAREAVMLGALLSEGGEFAFVLLAQAQGTNLIENELAGSAILAIGMSMIMTPWLYTALCNLTDKKSSVKPEYDEIENLKGRIVIAGFGRFGQMIARISASMGIPFTALDKDATHVDFVRKFGNEVFYGDASRLDLLQKAEVEKASVFVLAVDNVDSSIAIAKLIKDNFPEISLIARARNRLHAYELYELGVHYVYRETFESSLEAAKQTLIELGIPEGTAADKVCVFKRFDIEHLQESIAIRNDREALFKLARDGRKELASLMQADREDS